MAHSSAGHGRRGKLVRLHASICRRQLPLTRAEGDGEPDLSPGGPKHSRCLRTSRPPSPSLSLAAGELAGPPPSLNRPFKPPFPIGFHPPESYQPLSRPPVALPIPRPVSAGDVKQKPPLPVSHPGDTNSHFLAPHQIRQLLVMSLRSLSHLLPHLSGRGSADSVVKQKHSVPAPLARAVTAWKSPLSLTRLRALLPTPTALTTRPSSADPPRLLPVLPDDHAHTGPAPHPPSPRLR